jgi:hypothetical protein
MWSGGIDSTGALVSLLRVAEEEEDAEASAASGGAFAAAGAAASAAAVVVASTEAQPADSAPPPLRERLARLVVVMDAESAAEYPWFLTEVIERKRLRVVDRAGRSVSELAQVASSGSSGSSGSSSSDHAYGALVVTGELGDQLFGSDACRQAFANELHGGSLLVQAGAESTPAVLRAPATAAAAAATSTAAAAATPAALSARTAASAATYALDREARRADCAAPLHARGLDAPWQSAFLPALQAAGLLGGRAVDAESAAAAAAAWCGWVQPQLNEAPFPIVNTHDLLWWLNFSCKWQTVALRCGHDGGPGLSPGGTPLDALLDSRGLASGEDDGAEAAREDAMPRTALDASRRRRRGGEWACHVQHFYGCRELELWASVAEFHALKFGSLKVWQSYKEPLKAFVLAYTGDRDYYEHKEKVRAATLEGWGVLFRLEVGRLFFLI